MATFNSISSHSELYNSPLAIEQQQQQQNATTITTTSTLFNEEA